MQEGDRLRSAGDLRGALSRYQAAHALVRVPTTGLDLARVQEQLGMLVEARSTAIEVIHLPSTASEPHVFAEARAEATKLAGNLEAQIPALKTEVRPGDARYTLSIDGVVLPAAANLVPFRANPGNHSVRIEAPGFRAESRHVVLTEGQTYTLSVVLTPAPESVAEAPKPNADPNKPRLDEWSERYRVEELQARANAGRVRGILALGLGGSVLAVGAVTGVMSIVKTNHEKQACVDGACKVSQRDALSSANTLANISNITIPIGLLGIAYGVYELLTLPNVDRKPEHAQGIRVDVIGTYAVVRGSL